MAVPETKIVDFQTEALGRLRRKVAALDEEREELLAFARGNQGAAAQIHNAVLAVLDADGLDHLIHTITADWVDILGLDAVVLLLESGKQQVRATATGMQLLKGTEFKKLMPGDPPVLMQATPQGAPAFGPASDLIRGQALIRLNLPKPLGNGILALGSREEHSFETVSSTALLVFLGAVVERCLTRWMTARP
jgi:uncharacterized protein